MPNPLWNLLCAEDRVSGTLVGWIPNKMLPKTKNIPKPADTLPMIPADDRPTLPALPNEEDCVRLYYCNICGCNYSTGSCPEHNK